ncbi:MAG TPA: type II secretion system F family protein [Bacillales bacterium]|nr:type II secretion system F family protein [Bacillales bacterium]
MAALILSFFICSFLLFMWILLSVFSRKKDLDQRLKFYLQDPPPGQAEAEKKPQKRKPLLSTTLKASNQRLKDLLTTKKTNNKVESFLQGAGVVWTPGEYMIFRWIAGTIGGGLFYLLSGNLIILVLGFIVGYMYPRLWVGSKRRKRIRAFNDGLADMITSIINSLRAGFSFVQSLQAVEEEADSPIKEEITLVLKEMQYGSSLEEALNHLNERMPSEDLAIMNQAILIQRQVGGNLATVLASIVNTIRERNKIHRQVKTLTAQGKMSGMVIGGLPFGLGAIIYVIQPSYVGELFTNIVGIIMLGFAVISGTIGFILIQKISRIEV